MKKILIFSLAYYPRVGGAEVAIKEITDRISDIEFHMITLRFGQELREEKVGNVFVHRIGQGPSYFSKISFVFHAAQAARRLHAKEKFDAAWAMMSYMLVPIVRAGLKLPYVLTLQEGDTYQHMFSRLRVLPLLPYLNKGFKEASIVQTISHYLAGWARSRGFTGLVEVVPNGVDVGKFEGEKISHQGVILVTSSRLVHKNAVDVIIRALPKLPDVEFKIFGTGPEEAMLKKLAADLQMEDRVHFMGHVSHERLPTELHKADVFIRPSRSEGMGISFVEAMAAGLPVVATQEGGIADFLFDEKRNPDKTTTGWAVDKDSPEQIAQAVKEILANPEKTAAVVRTAKAMVTEKYDWNLIAREMREKVFNRVL
jgi:glycosyltransferase involved in cell wall biosynthesis